MVDFSHTYIMREVFDEDSFMDSIWTLSGGKYHMIPHEGYIDYEALDHTHTWRIHTVRNKFGFFMTEYKHEPSQVFETGFQLL
jgi:hypothetical protein